MPTRVTRLGRKRHNEELGRDAPQKKARVKLMKELATKYVNKSNKLIVKDTRYFNNYYNEKKMVFPWLAKESLRWHVGRHSLR